jgi:hypothetical protein
MLDELVLIIRLGENSITLTSSIKKTFKLPPKVTYINVMYTSIFLLFVASKLKMLHCQEFASIFRRRCVADD